jgi:hypothetical protein
MTTTFRMFTRRYIYIALKLFLTNPASNCSAERSFSVLKRIKYYPRSKMGEKILQNVADHEVTKKLSFEDIIESFANSRCRRKLL